MSNRIVAYSPWPSEAQQNLEQSQRDYDFVRALAKCGIAVMEQQTIQTILIVAGTESMKAKAELHRRSKP